MPVFGDARLARMAKHMKDREEFVKKGSKRKSGSFTATQTGAKQLAKEKHEIDLSGFQAFEDLIGGKRR